jgi:glucose/arabinose dehydrogenase
MRVVAVVCLAVVLGACAADGTAVDVTFSTEPAPTPDATPGTTADAAASTTTSTTMALSPELVSIDDVVGGLDRPVDLAWRAGDDTLYIVGQRGVVTPVRSGVAGEPVVDIAAELSDGGEQGLLGLEFHPSLPVAFLHLTDRDGGTQVIEVPVTDQPDGTASFDLDARRTLLSIDQPYPNHNGGDLAIDADGMLLIALGDGGSANDPERRSLDVTSLLGKILRIDPRPAADGAAYSIPIDNPFVGTAGARPEIWSVGLRNPWRIDLDPVTAELWIPDVGQGTWEEVNVVDSGRGVSFGWSAFEGTHRFHDDQPDTGHTPPLFEYEHGDAGCSVSGAMAYRGTAIPSLVGWFLFSDYCSGRLLALRATADGTPEVVQLHDGLGAVSAIRRGPDGEAYVLVLDSGKVLTLSGVRP